MITINIGKFLNVFKEGPHMIKFESFFKFWIFFEVGPSKSPSALSSSSSSSSSNPEEELDFTAAIEAQNQVTYAEHRTILNVYANNYLLIAYYLNQEDNDQPCHRGSIPGYKVIHRGREEAKHNLWDDYFTKNPQYN
ncbi:hypothetical protein ACOSQ3_022686 [Xanthoceras sorbifolium]